MGRWIGRLFRGDERPAQPGPPLAGSDPRFLPGGEPQLFRGRKTAWATDASGRRIFRSGVGYSTVSQAEADRLADEQARRALSEALAGRQPAAGGYGYSVDRRSEPLIEVIGGPGPESARITVNSYGSIVMNAAGALFVDVDTGEARRGEIEERPPEPLDAAIARDAGLGVRAYRTRAGWRYLVTNRLFDPSASTTAALLADLEADPQYVLLCRAQRSFRARLTPKPWRAGRRPVPISPNRGVERDELQRYVDGTWRYATTRLVASLGRDETSPELAPIVAYHDRWTQAESGKPLA